MGYGYKVCGMGYDIYNMRYGVRGMGYEVWIHTDVDVDIDNSYSWIALQVFLFYFADLQSEKHRRMLYSMEMEQMAESAKTQMEDVSHIQTDFVTATQIGHVKTMFKVRCESLSMVV